MSRTGKITAAQLVGSYAHSLVTAGAIDMFDDAHRTVSWDDITPSWKVAERQASVLAQVADCLLSRAQIGRFSRASRKWETDDSISLPVHQDGARAVFRPQDRVSTPALAAWLQVGAYLTALSDDQCIYGGILHVPRRKLNAEMTASLEIRQADLLCAEFRLREERIANLVNGEQAALPTPGMHCRRCWNDCVVRSMPPDE